jgi:hypothetical protein
VAPAADAAAAAAAQPPQQQQQQQQAQEEDGEHSSSTVTDEGMCQQQDTAIQEVLQQVQKQRVYKVRSDAGISRQVK